MGEANVFSKFYPRLGRMHTIMSFWRCVGKFMTDSGLSDILKHVFREVEKMLSGRKYPTMFGDSDCFLENSCTDTLRAWTHEMTLTNSLQTRRTRVLLPSSGQIVSYA